MSSTASEVELHSPRKQIRVGSQPPRRADLYEACSFVEPFSRLIPTRDLEDEAPRPRVPGPVHDGSQHCDAMARRPVGRGHPHLEQASSVRFRRIDSAPCQSDESLLVFDHQRKVRWGTRSRRDALFPRSVGTSLLSLERASERFWRIPKGPQPDISICPPLMALQASQGGHGRSIVAVMVKCVATFGKRLPTAPPSTPTCQPAAPRASRP